MQLISATPFLRDLYRLVNMSQILNLTTDTTTYTALYHKLAAEYHATWWSESVKGYADGQQAANVLALSLPGVVPANLTGVVLGSLVNDIVNRGQWTTGIVSIAQLFPLLSSTGHHDLALQLALKTTYPSYGYSFTNPYENATTLWEIWNAVSADAGMNSRNHHMFASIGAWFYRYLAGINPNALSPILIHPRLATNHSLLPSLSAELVTVAGSVHVSYRRPSATLFAVEVVVPVGVQARLTLESPVRGGRCVRLREGGVELVGVGRLVGGVEAGQVEGVLEVRESAETREVQLLLESGHYAFEAEWEAASEHSQAPVVE